MFDPDKRFSLIWTIAGAYLLYLGDDLLTTWYKGGTDYPLVALIAGVSFVFAGGFLLFMAWKKWHTKDTNSENHQHQKEND